MRPLRLDPGIDRHEHVVGTELATIRVEHLDRLVPLLARVARLADGGMILDMFSSAAIRQFVEDHAQRPRLVHRGGGKAVRQGAVITVAADGTEQCPHLVHVGLGPGAPQVEVLGSQVHARIQWRFALASPPVQAARVKLFYVALIVAFQRPAIWHNRIQR